VQVDFDLRLVLGARPSGLEFEHGEGTGRGLDDTIDCAADQPPVERHRERHLVKPATRRVQAPHVVVRANRRVARDGRLDDTIDLHHVIELVAAKETPREVAHRIG